MKKLIIAFCLGMASVASQASYLWFTVANDDDGYGNISSYLSELKKQDKISNYSDVYVSIVADNGTKTALYTETPIVSEWQMAPGLANVDLSDLKGSLSAYSFYIEIATSKTGVYNPIGSSNAQTYDYLYGQGYVSDSMTDVPSVGVWHGAGYKATPEPTSAMLMLLGVAGLALRRKQRKIA